MTRSLTILGATGSVGSQALDLVARNPGRWQVEALTANSDAEGLAAAARASGARFAAVGDDKAYGALKDALFGSGIEPAAGAEALCEAARRPGDIVLTAIVGAAGPRPDAGGGRARRDARHCQQGDAGLRRAGGGGGGQGLGRHAAAGRQRA